MEIPPPTEPTDSARIRGIGPLIRNQRGLETWEVLEHVELDKRGLGSTGGGLKGYAEGVGYDKSTITAYRQAAEVFRSISLDIATNANSISLATQALEKANHLREIHKAPRDCWRAAD